MTVIAYTSAAPAPLVSQSNAVVGQASLPQNIQLYGAGEDTADPGATFTYLWSILSAPPGSTAALSSSTAQNPLLNGVNVWGNYILMLVVTSSTSGASQSNPLLAPDTARVGVQVTSASAGLQKTAQGERNWFPPGYWPVVDKVEQHDQILNTLTLSTQAGGTLTVKAAVNLAAGDIVYPSDIAMVGAETVLVASKAPATNSLVTTSQLLIMEEAVLSGATGNARWFGLSAVAAAGSPAVLDPVYVSDTATLTLTPGTNFRQVGQVVEASGGLYRTLMLAGAAGGGSPTAQVLLQTADSAFPAGIDISALAASVEFTDDTGILSPGSFGAPVLQRFDKGGTGVTGDAVAVALGALKNARLVPGPAWVTAGGVVVRWIDPTDTAEIAEIVLAAVIGGNIAEFAVLQPNKLLLPDTSGATQGLEIESDYNLRVGTSNGPLTLDPADDLILYANGNPVARTLNDEELWQPTNTTILENRIPRRKAVSTLNATPTVLDSFTPALSENYVICVEATVVGMDAAASMYITAKRVARFAYDFSGPTLVQLGSTYVPVPDDAAGGALAVDLTASGGSIALIVTGDAATTIEWTAWTQFLITKIG